MDKKQEWNGVLRGGPFLEVSMVLENPNTASDQFIKDCLEKLTKLTINFQIHSKLTPKLIHSFHEGYLDVESNPNSLRYHHTEIPFLFEMPEERKSVLYIDEIAPNTIQFDWAFYGAEEDAPEWDQIGIKDEDLPKFYNLFDELYQIYQFSLGTVAIENDCVTLFPSEHVFPHETYRLEHFDPNAANQSNAFVIKWHGQNLRK